MLLTRLPPADPTKPRWHVAGLGSGDVVDHVLGDAMLRARRLSSSLRTYDLSRRNQEQAGGAFVDDLPLIDAVLLAIRPASLALSAELRRNLAAAAYFGVDRIAVVVFGGVNGGDRAEAVARAVVDDAGLDGNAAVVGRGFGDGVIVDVLDRLADVADRAARPLLLTVNSAYRGHVDVVVDGGVVSVGDVVVGFSGGGFVSAVVERVAVGGTDSGSARAGDGARLQLALSTALGPGTALALAEPPPVTTTLRVQLRSLTTTQLRMPWSVGGWSFGLRGRVLTEAVVESVVVEAGTVVEDVGVQLPQPLHAPPGTPVRVSLGVELRAIGRVL